MDAAEFAEFPTAIDLARGLSRRWRSIAALGALASVLAAGTIWLMLPAARYTAQAMLHVSAIPPRWIQVTNTHDSLIDFQTYQRTQAAQLKSKIVLGPVLASPGVRALSLVQEQKDPLAWLERELQARFDGEVLRISLSDERPDGLAEIVNAVVETYLREVASGEQRERTTHRDQLKRIYENTQDRLKDARRELDSLVAQAGASDVATMQLNQEGAALRRESALRRAQELEYDLRQCRAELDALELEGPVGMAVAPALGEGPKSLPADRDWPTEALQGDQTYRALQEQARDLDQKVANLGRVTKKKSDPVLMEHQKQRTRVRLAMAERENALRARAESRAGVKLAVGPNPVDPSRPPLDEFRRRQRVLEDLKAKADEDVEKLASETQRIGRDSIELELIRGNLEHIDEATKKVGNMVEALTVELNAPSRVLPLEQADAPRKQPDKRVQVAGLTGVGAFGLVALIISFMEFRSRRVGSPEEVIRSLPLTIIGTLPTVPTLGRVAPMLGHDQRWRHMLLESVDALRALLVRARRSEGTRSVMITSAVGGEGKTSLASHLSTSLARAGLKTLLIDADLRRPAVHRLFDLPVCPGLAEVLAGEVPFEDAFVPVAPLRNLWILTAGGPGRDVAYLLAQPAAHDLLACARTMFDFVIIDTAPVLPVADTLLIGQQVDATIFSILRTVSRLPDLRAAQERLARVDVRVLGAVVTGVRGETYGIRDYDYNYDPTFPRS